MVRRIRIRKDKRKEKGSLVGFKSMVRVCASYKRGDSV
jgi:hypothetical protein